MSPSSRSVRFRVYKDVFTVTLHPGYLHLRQTRSRHQYFIHEIYIPRRLVIPLTKWLLRSLRQVPPSKSVYPPREAILHYRKIAELEADQKRAKKQVEEIALKRKRPKRAAVGPRLRETKQKKGHHGKRTFRGPVDKRRRPSD